MAAAPPRSSREDVMQFLDELDNIPSSGTSSSGAPAGTQSKATRTGALPPSSNAEEAQSVLDFLDEITQRSATPTAPVPPASAPSSRASLEKSSSRSSLRTAANQSNVRNSSELTRPSRTSFPATVQATKKDIPPAATPVAAPAHASTSSGSWGWSSMWTQASSALEQAKKVAEENLAKQSSNLASITSQQEQAKKWMSDNVMGMVKGVDVEKLGQGLKATSLKTFTDILNAVAPPIAEHEVIEVWLSHDMIGYEGVETLVYRALAKVMEQIEGGDLVVNNGSPDRANTTSTSDAERDLNVIEGTTEAYKLALADLDTLIASNPSSSKPSSEQDADDDLPITICPIFMRVQPVLHALPFSTTSEEKQLSFILVLRDTTHDISTQTITQALPASWLDIPFEENEWVENEMVDVIRKGVEIVGQEYVRTRQTGRARKAEEVARKDREDAGTEADRTPEEEEEKTEAA